MTKEEFYEKYGDCLVHFVEYHKFIFVFGTSLPVGQLRVEVGGNADDIYRFYIFADEKVKLRILEPHSGAVYDDQGMEIESFYGY